MNQQADDRMPGTIFVVDDDKRIAGQYEQALRDAGYAVVVTHSAEQLLALVEGAAAPAALITDIRLPGASGWTLARDMRQRFPELPVLYISGDSIGDWTSQGVADSAAAEKPLVAPTLLRILASVLAQGRRLSSPLSVSRFAASSD
ncbi:response regulator [Rhizorhabdus wittichii DC-6]|nr:response regulator [Rhizorhabdus wittichii DC-6]